MSPSSIGMTDLVLPITSASTSSTQTSGDDNDASTPQFAAALHAAHSDQSQRSSSTNSKESDAKAGDAASDDVAKDPTTHRSDKNARGTAMDLPLQNVTTLLGGTPLRPLGSGSAIGSHRVRSTPQDADPATSTTDATALTGSTMPLGLLPNATAILPTATATATTTTTAAAAAAAKAALNSVDGANVAAVSTTAPTTAATAADATATTAAATATATSAATQPAATAPTASKDSKHTATAAGAVQNPHAASTGTAVTAAAAGSQAVAHSGAAHDSDRTAASVKDSATAAIGKIDTTLTSASAQNAQQATPTQQVSSVTPALATTASAATASTYAAAQPELANTFTHLSTRANGEHEMTVALHPAELGSVHVRALMHDGTLTVTIACADDAARHAVTAALPDLHNQLSGLKGLDVQLSGGQPDGRPAGDAQPGGDNGSAGGRGENADSRTQGSVTRIDSSGAVTAQHTIRPAGGRNDAIDRWM